MHKRASDTVSDEVNMQDLTDRHIHTYTPSPVTHTPDPRYTPYPR